MLRIGGSEMILLGADHRGYHLKEEIKKYLEEQQIQYKDYGTDSPERMDYPVVAESVCNVLSHNTQDKAILICGTGCGMTIVANKFKGIRCSVGYNEEIVKEAKAHSNINVLSLPADYVSTNEAINMIRIWLGTDFLQGRYQERVKMIEEIEKENMK